MTTEGPVLIVAGPGTGKTFTIVHRIAYLIQQGVRPENIVAVTFTNRAAKEMKERTEALLGSQSSHVFIGTFHFLGIRIISEYSADNFIIYNRNEQIRLIKTFLKDSDLREISKKGRNSSFALIAEKISRFKNFLDDLDDGMKGIYERYQSALRKNSALDFDDLILKPIEIFGNRAVLEKYRDVFRYIMVDEYQDINPAQYTLLMLLANSKGNICAIGDSDQAIYAFRGADVGNFLNFEKDFKDAKKITLKENYRSTGTILNASSFMIKNNLKRIDKELISTRQKGAPVNVVSVPDERSEGEFIVREIEERIGGTSHYQLMSRQRETSQSLHESSCGFSDFAVLFRTNAQSSAIEESFIKSGIPYQIIGEKHALKRREITDTLSYLKVISNPADNVNLERIATLSPKGINEATILNISRYAEENGLSLYEAMKTYNPLSSHFSKGGKGEFSKEGIREFISMLERFMDLKHRLPFDEFVKVLLKESGLREYYKDREDNLMFLENLAYVYRDIEQTEALTRFINELSLFTPADAYDPKADAVTLMTLHMAKGLEFKVVFIAGVEEGLIPYTIKKDAVDLEEERRLFYAGMTRAQDEIFLISARNRFFYGQKLDQSPSSFLNEIPEELVKSGVIQRKIKKDKETDQMGLF